MSLLLAWPLQVACVRSERFVSVTLQQKSTEIKKCNGNTLPNCVPDKILLPFSFSSNYD